MFSLQLLVRLIFLLPSSALCASSVVDSIPTYEHQDPSTGKTLLCTKCPPGTHMVAHCTSSTPTKCVPCGENQFTELWNYLPRCLYCGNFCYDNQEVEKECSATSNRVCRCKEGFYSSADFCFRHSECKPGLGVQTKGMKHSALDLEEEKTRQLHYSSDVSQLWTPWKNVDALLFQERQKRTQCVNTAPMVISPIRRLRKIRA